jgi:hypothetical protein
MGETGLAFALASQGYVEGKVWGSRSQVLWRITPLGKARLGREESIRHAQLSERAREPGRALRLIGA